MIDDELIDLAASCAHDPARWVRMAYDWGVGGLEGATGPRAWQEDILRAIGDHLRDPVTRHQPCQIAVASGHGPGKSALVGMIANWALSTQADTRVLVTANTETQLRTKTTPEIAKWTRSSITASWWDVQATSVSGRDKGHQSAWRLDCVPWSEHNTEAFAGLHNQGRRIVLVFDEASSIHDRVWEVAEGALTDEDTEIIWLAFGNPTRAGGRFRECFESRAHRWITRQIDTRTVEGINLEQINRVVEDYGEDSDYVRVRVRGLFPSAAIEGAYYARMIEVAYSDGRIGRVAADPLLQLRAFVDIGGAGAKADAFAIWVAQFVGREIRVLDYYEAQGQPLGAHLEWMRGKGYTPARCSIWLPHDGATQDRVYSVSYESALKQAGYAVTVVPNQGRGAAMGRIEALRRHFPAMWFNEEACKPGLDALGWYHEKRDPARGIGLGPDHDWSSHAADAAGLMAIVFGQPAKVRRKVEEKEELTYSGAASWMA